MSFIGRTKELEKIQGFINQPETGILLIYGESGVGKTSILEKIKEEIKDRKNSEISNKTWIQWPPEVSIDFENPLNRFFSYLTKRKKLKGEKVVYSILDAHTISLVDYIPKLEDSLDKINRREGKAIILLETWPVYKERIMHKLEKLRDKKSIRCDAFEIPPLKKKDAKELIKNLSQSENVRNHEREILDLSRTERGRSVGYIPILIESFVKAYSKRKFKQRLEEMERHQIGLVDYLESLRKKYKLNDGDWKLLHLLAITRGFSREMEDVIIESYNNIFEDSIVSPNQFWKRVTNLKGGPISPRAGKEYWVLNLHDRLIETLLFHHNRDVSFELLESFIPKAIDLRTEEVARNIALSLESPLIYPNDSRVKRFVNTFLDSSLKKNRFPKKLINCIYYNHVFSLNHKKLEQILVENDVYNEIIQLANSENLGLVAKLLYLVSSKKSLNETNVPFSELLSLVENSSNVENLSMLINSLNHASPQMLNEVCKDLDLSDYLTNCSVRDLAFFLNTIFKTDQDALNSSLNNEKKKINQKIENIRELISSHELSDVIEFLRIIKASDTFEITKDNLIDFLNILKDNNTANISLQDIFKLLYLLPSEDSDLFKKTIQILPVKDTFENADQKEKMYFEELVNVEFRREKRRILSNLNIVKSSQRSRENIKPFSVDLKQKNDYDRSLFEFSQNMSKLSIYLVTEKGERKKIGEIKNPKLLWDPVSIQRFPPKLIRLFKKVFREQERRISYNDVKIKWSKGVWPPSIDGLHFANLVRKRGFKDFEGTDELIDLGCGTGFLSIYIAKHCDWIENIHFCDVRQKALSLAETNAREILSNQTFSFHRGNAFSVEPPLKKENCNRTTIICHPPYIPVPQAGEQSLFEYSDPLHNPHIDALGTYLIRGLIENGGSFADKAFLLHSNLSEKDLRAYIQSYPKSLGPEKQQIGEEKSIPFRVPRIMKSFEYLNFLQERGLKPKSREGYTFWHDIKVDLINFSS